MAQAGTTWHEGVEQLSQETRERHRALVSLMEELEAIDWYDQRIDASKDQELRAILTHNRDEEKEHAILLLEWLRRKDPKLDQELKERLFRAESFTRQIAEEKEEGSSTKDPGHNGSLAIGSLKGS